MRIEIISIKETKEVNIYVDDVDVKESKIEKEKLIQQITQSIEKHYKGV